MKRQESLVDERRTGGVGDPSGDFSAVIDMHGQGKGGHDVSLFSFQTIEAATENFSSSNLLGEGGFGPVYKVKISTLIWKQYSNLERNLPFNLCQVIYVMEDAGFN